MTLLKTMLLFHPKILGPFQSYCKLILHKSIFSIIWNNLANFLLKLETNRAMLIVPQYNDKKPLCPNDLSFSNFLALGEWTMTADTKQIG